MPSLTYLSFDPLTEGVGASQIVPYVVRLRDRGWVVALHTFERNPPPSDLVTELRGAGVSWTAHAWGRTGPVGGVARIARSLRVVRTGEVVHARGDLAGLAASTRRRDEPWVWDMRAFFRDQRRDQGSLAAGGLPDRALGLAEARLARRSAAIVTLAERAGPILDARHGPAVGRKVVVIPTCVDLDRFVPAERRPGPWRIGLIGTLNRLYDVPAMLALARACAQRAEVDIVAVTPARTAWDDVLAGRDVLRRHASPPEMPDVVRELDVGLSVLGERYAVSAAGAMPTKIGEFLASGRPVVVSPGLGDMEAILDEHRCGVVFDGTAVEVAAEQLLSLLEDADLGARCRAAAEHHFDVERGVERLASAYEATLVSPGPTAAAR